MGEGKEEWIMPYDAVLPSGGRITGAFEQKAGVSLKALIPHERGTVLEHIIAVLRETNRVGRIVVVGPENLSGSPSVKGADFVLPEGESGAENCLIGLKWLAKSDTSPKALIVTTDLPFLSCEAVNAFLDACPQDGDICIPILTKEELESRFPGSENTYVPLKDGFWTMGGVYLVNPGALLGRGKRLEDVFAARKSQFRMACLLGPKFILRFLTKRLTVADIESKCGDLFRCCGYAIRNSPPELAFDMDELKEYEYYLRWSGFGK
jgi:hypothetical protein